MRLVSTSNKLDDVIKELQLKEYEPLLKQDVSNTQLGDRYRIVKSPTEQDYVIKWSKSVKPNTKLNSNSETIDFLYTVFENNNINLIESKNDNYESLEFIGKMGDFELNSDILGRSDVFVKLTIPVIGKKLISFTRTMIKCNNQIPNLKSDVLNSFIDFDNNHIIDIDKVKAQMTYTQNILENFSQKEITTNQLVAYYSDVYGADDIREDRPTTWKNLYSHYCDADQPNHFPNTLLGGFNTLTYYLSNKPRKTNNIFLQDNDSSKIRNAFKLGSQLINS